MEFVSTNPQTKYELEQPVNPSQPLFNAKLYRNLFLMWCWAFLMSNFIKCYACKHNACCTSHLEFISSAVCMMVKKYQYVCSYLSWSIVNCKSFHSFLNEIYLLWLVVKILFFLLYFIATFFYCLQSLLWGIFLISRLLYLSYFYIYL